MRSRQAGFGLVDALIALAILAFGLLGMTRLQTRALAQGSESRARTAAMHYADELASYALIDGATNVNCYTLPSGGACGSATARSNATGWQTRLQADAAMPAASANAAYDATTKRYTVTVTWTGKESQATRTLTAATDVR